MNSTYEPSQEPKKKQGRADGGVMFDLTNLLNKGLDRLMRIGAHDTLNNAEPTGLFKDLPRELSILSKGLKSEAIDETGQLVDYSKLIKSDAYIQFKNLTNALPSYNLADLGNHNEQLAFWINLYNTLIIDAVIHYQIKDSVLRMPSFFRRAAYNVGGYRFSADDIEHGILRGNRPHPFLYIRPFGKSDPRKSAMLRTFDPRLHFTLVCGALSCPPIAFYDSAQLDDQLSASTSSFINGDASSLDSSKDTIWLSKIFKWYQDDFGGWEGVKRILCEGSQDPALCEALNMQEIKVKYQPYDWSINRYL